MAYKCFFFNKLYCIQNLCCSNWRFVVLMYSLPALISLGICLHLPFSHLNTYSISDTVFSAILGEPGHFAQPAWETGRHCPPHHPHYLLSLPPSFSTSSSSSCSVVVETDFPEGRRGRLRWWICRAEACLSDPAAWKTWLAPGIVQGTYREAHNCEQCLGSIQCVVSLLFSFLRVMLHMVACLCDLHLAAFFTLTNPLCFCSSGGLKPFSRAVISIGASWKFDTNCLCWPTKGAVTHHINHDLFSGNTCRE